MKILRILSSNRKKCAQWFKMDNLNNRFRDARSSVELCPCVANCSLVVNIQCVLHTLDLTTPGWHVGEDAIWNMRLLACKIINRLWRCDYINKALVLTDFLNTIIPRLFQNGYDSWTFSYICVIRIGDKRFFFNVVLYHE